MKVYIMRHGPAEDESASGRDFDRALTPAGRERVMSVARTLVDADEAPVSIVSSPLVRALQTAEIVAATTKLGDRGGSVETRREIAPGGSAVALIDELRRDKRRRVMLVGHEPDLSSLVFRLVGAQLPLGMLKAMVVGVSVTDEGTRMRFVLDPKSLEITR